MSESNLTEEEAILRTMATDPATDERAQKRARAVIEYLESQDVKKAAKASGLSSTTVKKIIRAYEREGWSSLITILAPRGEDFLARYDQGFWAERLVTTFLNRSTHYRAIPYGTSRSEPFTDLATFQKYAVSEALLQAWSSGQRWKRPDLLLIPRTALTAEGGNDAWTPDLLHWNNELCAQYLRQASAAVEVENSLWQVKKATVSLSFTVKDEDLRPLRNWLNGHEIPLYIVQVFYDQAYVLPFVQLEYLIGAKAPAGRRVVAIEDRFTKKDTYRIPLKEGVLLGDIPEPEVEGRVYKATNGRVTVYGRLTGSHIEPLNLQTLNSLASGRLTLPRT
jgi:hypothetical protein